MRRHGARDRTSDGEEIVRWRRNKSISLNSRDKGWSPPTPSCYRKKIKKIVEQFSVQYASERAHLSATPIGFFMNSSWRSWQSHLTLYKHLPTWLVNQSKVLSLRITKQRGSLRTRGVTFHFHENSTFLITAINYRQRASTLTKPRIQHFTDRRS